MIRPFVVLLLAAAPAMAADALTPGDHEVALTHQGLARYYLVHVPPKPAKRGGPRPVVIAFHGGGGSADRAGVFFKLGPLADEHGFVVVTRESAPPLKAKPATQDREPS